MSDPNVEAFGRNLPDKVAQTFYPTHEQRELIYKLYKDLYKAKKNILSSVDWGQLAAQFNTAFPDTKVPATAKTVHLQIKNAKSTYNEVVAKRRQTPWPYFEFFNEFWGKFYQ